jgi:hypothetical protein
VCLNRDNETRYATNETTPVKEIQHWHQRLHKWVEWTTGVLRPDNETRYRYNETSPPVQQREQWHRRLALVHENIGQVARSPIV